MGEKRGRSDSDDKKAKKAKKLEKLMAEEGLTKEEAKKKRKEQKKKQNKDNKPKTEDKQKVEKTTEVKDSKSEPGSVSSQGVDEFMKTNEITVEDDRKSNLQPYLSFDQLQVDSRVSKVLKQYAKPTPIQSVSWPFLLDGRDVIGVAETGSGKTMAFAVPAIQHLIENKTNHGVKVLVVSPTRELAMQIYDSLQLLTEACGYKAVCVYGGVPKEEQRRDLKKANIVIATPGRLNDLVNEESCNLSKVEYLVLDEADRMLEKGFEEDIKKIISNTNADGRQTLMFTATWPPQVRELASTFMQRDAVKVSIGDRDELSANKRISQTVEVVEPRAKDQRLLQLLKQYQSGSKKNDKVLIFALYKKEAARVERQLQGRGFELSAIHGDLNQAQRTKALEQFKAGDTKILLATDVAARGLDIPAVKVVINLTFPLTVEDYVHRIGRTGRAGQTGTAVTLFTEQEKHLSGALVNVLRGANQPVPEELLKFGTHTKKKEHSVYGAFYKDIDPTKKAKKITFD